MKVVINGCYGGFSISTEAVNHMAEAGSQEALAELEKIRERKENPSEIDKILSRSKRVRDSHLRDIARDNSFLIATVEALGKKANGGFADLRIVEIPDDVEWEIEEYDGREWVSEKHRTWS